MNNKLKTYHFIETEETVKERPTHDWISFEEEEPNHKQYIYYQDEAFSIGSFIYTKNNLSQIESDTGLITHWCDKESHDKKIKHYKDNQVIFEGWEIGIHKESFSKNGYAVAFFDLSQKVRIRKIGASSYIYLGLCSVQLLKDIFTENNIKL